MNKFGRTVLLASAAAIALPEIAFAQTGVSLLGALPGAPLNSSGGAVGVSADGTVAVGRSGDVRRHVECGVALDGCGRHGQPWFLTG